MSFLYLRFKLKKKKSFLFLIKHPAELAILLVNDRVSSQHTIRISLFFLHSL